MRSGGHVTFARQKECDQSRSGLRQEKARILAINADSLALAPEAFIEFDKSSC
jgi:hypothetical protein